MPGGTTASREKPTSRMATWTRVRRTPTATSGMGSCVTSPCKGNITPCKHHHQATITIQTSSPSNHHHANIITKQPSACKHHHQATISMQTSTASNHHHANIITKQSSQCKHHHQAIITTQASSPSKHHHEQGHYTYYRKPLPIKVFSQYLKTRNPEKTDTKPPRKVNPQG